MSNLQPIRVRHHSAVCRCSACTPRTPAARSFWQAAQEVGAQQLAGIMLGVVGTLIYDALTGGPGIGVILGL